MKVREIAVTTSMYDTAHTAEDLIAYCARVSNPANQENTETGEKLLRYCIEHKHWSVFEMADWTVEIETSRAIAAQILRHRSFSFQEFSQRYAAVGKLGDELFETPELREKAVGGNRQGSGAVLNVENFADIVDTKYKVLVLAQHAYEKMLHAGVAPECARMFLPLCTRTRLYMKGSVRSWVHYFDVRLDGHAQKEHREVALAAFALFEKRFPIIASALQSLT